MTLADGVGLAIVLLFQTAPLDPSSYSASWGVLGALVFVVVILSAIVYSVFVKGSAAAQVRDKLLMDWTTDLTQRTTAALETLGTKISLGDDRLVGALDNQARMLRAVLLTREALPRARAHKADVGGRELSTAEMEGILRAADEAVRRGMT